MAKEINETELDAIEAAVRAHPDGAPLSVIAAALPPDLPRRTLQYRLRQMVDSGRLIREGQRKGTRYKVADAPQAAPPPSLDEDRTAAAIVALLSDAAREARGYLGQPVRLRRPVGYDRAFLDAYRPNETFYLKRAEREHLHTLASPGNGVPDAGTYAQNILSRLLIDLSWNSSRLEGNTYSLLDTRRLIEFGEAAAGRDRLEAQMILNHKDAIRFLTGVDGDIGFNRYTVLNLHAMLASGLLPDETAAGRLRQIPVGIDRSTFHPLEVPQLIEECFDQVLVKAASIADPFEQALFAMVQLPYLQPFDDVNKRVSRLAANIPFLSANLIPLSFADVPRGLYVEAILSVYELNRVDLLKELFLWAYARSADRYRAVQQSLGAPEPFRLQYRDALREVVGAVVRGTMGRAAAAAHLTAWIKAHISGTDRARFRDLVETELLGLHAGNFARYAIRPSEFTAWQEVWSTPPSA